MRKLYLCVCLLIFSSSIFSQVRYDNGPLRSKNSRFVTTGSWGRTNITYSISGGTNDIAGLDERQAIRDAFKIWEDYSLLSFTEVIGNSDINLSWGSGHHGDWEPFDGVLGTLAHASEPSPDGAVVHFDDAETWSLNEQPGAGQPIDLVTIAAHEIGHTLGLGHSNDSCALMYAWYSRSHRYLELDDINGIRSLYGSKSPIVRTNNSCTGGTYTIRNVPTGATVTWSSLSGLNLIPTAGSGTSFTWTGNAHIVDLTAQLTLPSSCGNVFTETMTLYVGAPLTTFTIDNFMPSTVTCYEPDAFYIFRANTYLGGGHVAYEWGYRPQGTTFETLVPAAGPDATFIFSSTGTYEIFVRPVNSCGTGSESVRTITVESMCWGSMAKLNITTAPNPATNDLYVTVDNGVEDAKAKNTGPSEIEINLHDIYTGKIVKKWKFVNDQKRYHLNVGGVKKGQYILQIIRKNGKVSKHIILK